MHAVFQEVGTVFVEKHALNAKNVSKLFSACLNYLQCNVIWASGFVGIHMLKRTPNPILTFNFYSNSNRLMSGRGCIICSLK